MREREAEFTQRGVRIVAVSFESDARTREFQMQQRLPFQLLRDPGRVAYKHFGLERAAVQTILAPATVWYYIRRVLSGQRQGRASGDMYQLGGNVLLDSNGSALWVYRSNQPADRPSVDAILREIDRHPGV